MDKAYDRRKIVCMEAVVICEQKRRYSFVKDCKKENVLSFPETVTESRIF